MKLRRLSGLEREKIDNELKELIATIADLEFILSSEERKNELIQEQLLEMKEKYNIKFMVVT